jgi:hypothetical protein
MLSTRSSYAVVYGGFRKCKSETKTHYNKTTDRVLGGVEGEKIAEQRVELRLDLGCRLRKHLATVVNMFVLGFLKSNIITHPSEPRVRWGR